MRAYDARKIIYPGKGFDDWWNLDQLIQQTDIAIDIFEYTHPGKVGVWAFDCSTAHEGFADDALSVRNMNVNPGGKQTRIRDTIIPLNNPPPSSGKPNTRGAIQSMVFPLDHSDPKLSGKPKGMRQVLRERESVWEELERRHAGKKIIGKCGTCQKSQKKKDAERRIARAEAMGQEETLNDEDCQDAALNAEELTDEWCCMIRVLSLQQDFVDEKPQIQHLLENRGHKCIFLPKFHCELNPIEFVWGYAKYRESFHLLP